MIQGVLVNPKVFFACDGYHESWAEVHFKNACIHFNRLLEYNTFGHLINFQYITGFYHVITRSQAIKVQNFGRLSNMVMLNIGAFIVRVSLLHYLS